MKLLAFTFDLSLINQTDLLITLTGYCLVLVSLSLMAYIFIRLHTIQDYLAHRRVRKKSEVPLPSTPKPAMTGEENAAIATALYLFLSDIHDNEKYVMTIKRVSRTYSPWSSKVYGVWSDIR